MPTSLCPASFTGVASPSSFSVRLWKGEINLTVSQAIIDETIEVLSRKFGATAEDLAEARAIIGEAARVAQPTGRD